MIHAMEIRAPRRIARALCAVAMALLLPLATGAQAPGLDAQLHAVQNRWAQIEYSAPEQEHESRFSGLAGESRRMAEQFPDRAEARIWYGTVLTSWAGAKGGPGALALVKQAKAEFEQAIAIDPAALGASALSRLGLLYGKVPGWPIGFGDDAKAEQLFKQALAINPGGIDTNYFYADFLVARKRFDEARRYLARAQAAPPRPGYEALDAGRRADIAQLVKRLPQ
ncbi:hypothetical protein GCM10023144_00200 [Pigmentiphaga soli]|uniref:Tetratricopeptide repeat protein n=1 Tax=Pigmentiphaga soli TaxID=1007095 RepID=A0ABP8GBD1_9BURK